MIDMVRPPNWLIDWIRDRKGKPAVKPSKVQTAAKSQLPEHLRASRARLQGAGVASVRERLEEVRAGLWRNGELARLCSALKHLPADGYDDWVRTGMALKDLGWFRIISESFRGSGGPVDAGILVDVGFEVWDRWSRTKPDKYPGREELAHKWESFRGDRDLPVTVASIYQRAREAGWQEDRIQTGTDFQTVSESFRGPGFKPETDLNPGTGGQIKNPTDRPTKNSPTNGAHASAVNSNEINGMESLAAVLPAAIAEAPIVWADISQKGRRTVIDRTCANTRIALRHLGIECRYDVFHDRLLVAGTEIKQWEGRVHDNALHAIRSHVRDRWILEPSLTTMKEAIVAEALEHCFDPVVDYLDSLTWDGTARLATWLHAYLGAEDTPLNREISRLSLVAAVRRAREPGTKFDHAIVLEGRENIGKSTAIEIMAGRDNFSDQAILAEKEQRQQELLQGVWLYELAELTGQRRAEVEHAKAFISRSTDRGRRAFGHFVEEQPRRCVLFATCNENRYLVSQTGNRRYLSVHTTWVLQDSLRRDRDQLWAEASVYEARRMPLWVDPKHWAAASAMQESRRVQDPWEDELQGIERQQKKGVQAWAGKFQVTTQSLMGTGFLNIPAAQRTQAHGTRLNTVMRILGWEGPKTIAMKLVDDENEAGPSEKNKYRAWGFTKDKD